MSRTDKIDQLVATVRRLNFEIRPKVTNTPGGDPPGNPIHTSLAELRDHEVMVSQVLRVMSLADTTVAVSEDRLAQHQPAERVGSRQLLSEFGTARESILSLLRTLDDESWDLQHETPDGLRSITQVVDELIDSDRERAASVIAAVAQR